MRVAVDHARLEPALKEMALAGITSVEPARVATVQPLHSAGELGLGRLDEQVEVIVEEVPDVHFPAKSALDLDEQLEPRSAVVIVERDRPLLDAAADDVVPSRARQAAARDPRHGATLPRRQRQRNRREGTTSRDSPSDTSFADAPVVQTAL
jgi:hypothetical protein